MRIYTSLVLIYHARVSMIWCTNSVIWCTTSGFKYIGKCRFSFGCAFFWEYVCCGFFVSLQCMGGLLDDKEWMSHGTHRMSRVAQRMSHGTLRKELHTHTSAHTHTLTHIHTHSHTHTHTHRMSHGTHRKELHTKKCAHTHTHTHMHAHAHHSFSSST